nr:hypothetical protein [Ilumatobacteraceae bacterium]
MRRGRLLVGLGVGAIVLAIATVVAAWFVDQRRLDDAVADLARAAAGCETTIEMRSTGAYAVYLEPQGEAPALPGDCEQAVGSGEGLEIEVIAPDGRLVEVDDTEGPGYERAGEEGERIGTIEVTTPGAHLVRVVSPDGGV